MRFNYCLGWPPIRSNYQSTQTTHITLFLKNWKSFFLILHCKLKPKQPRRYHLKEGYLQNCIFEKDNHLQNYIFTKDNQPLDWKTTNPDQPHKKYTVKILSFQTDMPGQTVQTQIRSSLIRVYTVCHSVCIICTHYSMVEPHSSNIRVTTTNFWGIQIFREFMVVLLAVKDPHVFSSGTALS